MKPLALLLAIIGLIFLVAAALISGGVIAVAAAGWLLPAGLASWLAAWIVQSLPL